MLRNLNMFCFLQFVFIVFEITLVFGYPGLKDEEDNTSTVSEATTLLTTQAPVPPVCYESCDFENKTQCGWESAINPYVVQLWNAELNIPQPTDGGQYFALNNQQAKEADLDVPLGCSSGAVQVLFKAYIKQLQVAETTLEVVGNPSGATIFQYNRTSSETWEDLKVQVHPFHKATSVIIMSRLQNEGDILGLDDICISTCCQMFCDWETGRCPEWKAIIKAFDVQDWDFQTEGIPEPSSGSYYQVNKDKQAQKDNEVQLPCKSGTINFLVATKQAAATEAALQLLLLPSGNIIYKYGQASTDGWEKISIPFNVEQTTDTKIMFISNLLNANEFVALDDICFQCDQGSATASPLAEQPIVPREL